MVNLLREGGELPATSESQQRPATWFGSRPNAPTNRRYISDQGGNDSAHRVASPAPPMKDALRGIYNPFTKAAIQSRNRHSYNAMLTVAQWPGSSCTPGGSPGGPPNASTAARVA